VFGVFLAVLEFWGVLGFWGFVCVLYFWGVLGFGGVGVFWDNFRVFRGLGVLGFRVFGGFESLEVLWCLGVLRVFGGYG